MGGVTLLEVYRRLKADGAKTTSDAGVLRHLNRWPRGSEVIKLGSKC